MCLCILFAVVFFSINFHNAVNGKERLMGVHIVANHLPANLQGKLSDGSIVLRLLGPGKGNVANKKPLLNDKSYQK